MNRQPDPFRDTVTDFIVMIVIGLGVIVVIANYTFPVEPVLLIDTRTGEIQ
jgi:hypothetical protein